MEEIKSIGMDYIEIEYQGISKSSICGNLDSPDVPFLYNSPSSVHLSVEMKVEKGQNYQQFLELSGYQDSDTRKKATNFLSQSGASGTLLIENLIEEVKAILTWKHEVKDRDKSTLIAFFTVYASSRLKRMESKQSIFYEKSSLSIKPSLKLLMQKKPVVLENYELENRYL